jgi:diguanylate cyclase (GGDEF)-like protein
VNILSNNIANHFLESLITLTRERDSLELENCMLKTLGNLLKLIGCDVVSVEVFRLKEISAMFFQALTSAQSTEQPISTEYCNQLMGSYNTSSYKLCKLDSGEVAHMFPLKNLVAYLNAVVVVKTKNEINSQDTINAICQLLDIYQNYTALINDNERDTLTGLLNRKTFDNKINRIIGQLNHSHMRINDRSVSAHYIAIFDIDHFKKVNDEHGHLIGDEVLLLFSQLMAKSFRDTDPLFRFGGEEFVALFSCAQEKDIETLLTRFNDRLHDFNFPQVGKVTVSIGCVKITGDLMPSQYVDRADMALYYAKNNGRNQVRYYHILVEEGLLSEEIKEGEIELF